MPLILSGDTGVPVTTVTGTLPVANGGTGGASNFTGFKNRIINGAMVIDQRNAGASVTQSTADIYTIDRWVCSGGVSSKFTVQQNAGSVTPPAGYTKYLGVTSLSSYSVGGSDYNYVMQAIEGFNVVDLGFGSAGAATVTLSFWVRSSLTGNFGGALRNKISGADRGYPFTYTINAANTWEQKTVTATGDVTGTWATGNTISLTACFGLGTGSTFSGTSGAWAASNLIQPTSTVSVVGTNGATFYLTGVQLEVGSTATSFEYRPYGTELALCQRYLPAFNSNGSTFAAVPASCLCTSTSSVRANIIFSVIARTPPTGITVSSGAHFTVYQSSGATVVCTTASAVGFSLYGGFIDFSGASGLTAGNSSGLFINNTAGQLLLTGCEL